jgi:hypothetical protein
MTPGVIYSFKRTNLKAPIVKFSMTANKTLLREKSYTKLLISLSTRSISRMKSDVFSPNDYEVGFQYLNDN